MRKCYFSMPRNGQHSLIASVLLIVFLLVGRQASATVFPVTNGADAGAGSLRQAIINANAGGAGPHSITFSITGVINLNSPLPAITNAGITIDGGGSITISAQGGDIDRDIFNINASNTTLKGMTLRNTGSEAIQLNGVLSGVTIENITIRHTAGDYINHGIYVASTSTNMTIRNVTITDVQSAYWGIRFVGNVTNLLVDGYQTYGGSGNAGRGIQVQGVANGVTIKNSLIDLNSPVTGDDGDYGIYFNTTASAVNIDSCTFHDTEIYGVYFGAGASNIQIKHSSFDNFNGWTNNQMIFFNSNVSVVTIDSVQINSDMNGTTDDGNNSIWFNGNMKTVTIKNSYFKEADIDGIYAITGLDNDNILITNNTFEKIGTGGAHAGVHFTTVRNTTSDNGPVEISNNTFRDLNGVGIYLRPNNTTTYVIPNLVVKNNIITGCKVYGGIKVNYIDKIIISQNSIYNNLGTGIDLTDGSGANCGYEGANTPQLLSSAETAPGSGIYTVSVKMPAICGTNACSLELFSSEAGTKGIGGQHYVQTFTGLGQGVRTLTNVTGAFPEISGAPYGTWTATLRAAVNCGTSEFSNKIPIKPNGPAGVDLGIKLWLRGDDIAVSGAEPTASGQVITGWEEFSGGGAPSATTVINNPLTKLNGINFNPVADMDGDVIRGVFSGGPTWLPTATATTVAVMNPLSITASGDRYFVLYAQGAWDYNNNKGQIEFYRTGNNVQSYRGSTLLAPPVPGTTGVTAFNKPGVFTSVTTATNHTAYYNAQSMGSGNYSKGNFAISQWFVGGGYGPDANGNGAWQYGSEVDFAEVFTYNRTLTAPELQKVQSYMALKYGIAMKQNYVLSSGTQVWDVSADAAWSKEIAALVRDNLSVLHQKQAKAFHADEVVTIGVGSGLSVTNKDNEGNISNNLSVFMWGNDSAATTYSTPYISTYSDARMTRVWKVHKTNWSDTSIVIKVKGGNANRTLLVSADPAFPVGTTTNYPLNDTGAVILNSSLLGDGMYFTFANKISAPACVTTGIQAWYRADDANATISAWTDYSGYDRSATQATASNQPIKINNAINFNPAFDFDGSSDYLDIAHNLTMTGTNPFTVISVTKRGSLGTSDAILGQQSDATNSGAVFYTTGNKYGITSTNVTTVSTTGTYATANIPYLNTTTRSGNLFSLYTNGAADGTGTQAFNFLNVNQRIGRRGGSATDYFDGNISELVVYNRPLSATELQQVNSYLALKYGITLNNGATDYIASNGSTKMWEAAVNTAYNKDIAGIGKDTCGNLHQKQSRSINAGALIAIAIGDVMAADNLSNTNTVANNLSFLTWGDNGGATTFTTSITGANVTLRMPRVWKVDKTNWADTVITIKLYSSARNAYLLISNSDPSFATIDQEIALNGDSTITINSSLLPDGAYFTFGKQLLGPGYVNNSIVTWQRADDGLSTSDAWYDFSGNGNDAGQTLVAEQPVVLTGAGDTAINFNPGFMFKPTAEWFDYNNDLTLNGTGNKTVIWAARSVATTGTSQAILSHNNTGSNLFVAFHDASNHPAVAPGGGGSTCNPISLSAVPFGTPLIGAFNRTSASAATSYTNGGFPATSTCNSNFVGQNMRIGARSSSAFMPFNGNISEVIVYNRSLAPFEMQRVHSYLALKYGVTLDQTTPTDYVATDWDGTTGTKYWTAADNTGYGFRIAGIGRDEQTKLYQKQSRSALANAIITIAAGETIAADNLSNTATIDDLSFFTWSDNNGATTFTTAVTGVSNATFRMARVWKVDRTNWADQDITLHAEKIGVRYLLVNTTDPTFGAGTTEYIINTTTSSVTINSADLPDGAYFTLATKIVGPGCVNNGIQTWLRADYGSTVSNWPDFSGNQVNAAQDTAAKQPVLIPGGLNYNAALQFNGSTDYMKIPQASISGKFSAGNAARTLIGVGVSTTATDQMLVSYGSFVANQSSGLRKQASQVATFEGNGGASGVVGPANSFPNNKVTIISGRYTGGATGRAALYTNDTSTLASATMNWNTVLSAEGAQIGKYVGENRYWNGNIGEVIVYNRNITDAEFQRVSSYLALKYGITLDQTPATDYIASDGTTRMWTAADNTGYNFRITGIGRDDCDELYQKQSLSVESGGLVTVSIGSAVATTNAENTDTIGNNNSYFVVADNNLDTAWTIPISVSGITPTVRMPRVWKVDKTNWTDASMVFKYNRNPSRVFLLVSTDPAFATGVQQVELSITDSLASFSSDLLPDGAYFTFAKEVYGPGYVNSGIRLWLRADQNITSAGVGTAVTNWEDYSGNSVLFQQNGANPLPLYETQNLQFNFNPSLDFVPTGAEQMISLNSGDLVTPATFDNYSLFTAIVKEGTGAQRPFSMINTGSNGYVLDANTGGRAGLTFEYENGVAIPASQTRLLGISNGGTAATQRGYHNGKVTIDNTTTTSTMSDILAGTAELGAANGGTAFGGHMGEVIVYNRQVTPAEALRINSYLALKYGVTLDQTTPNNYVATNWDGVTGTVYWDVTANTGYNNNIAGIGRDDSTSLLQKQSRSVNTGGNIVAIGLESIAATNKDNTASFTDDLSFLVWGDNGLPNTQATEYPATALDPYGCSKITRLQREWKVQETGTVGFVQVKFYLAGLVPNSTTISDLTLLIDDDGTFARGVTTTVTPTAYDAATQTVTFDDIDFADGQYFTLVTDITNQAPGGIIANLYTWYRADKGVTTATGISQWNDQSVSLKNAAQATAANQPAYNTATGLINFNPAGAFDGTNDVLSNTAISHTGATNGEEIFAVVLPNNATGLRNVLGLGNATAGQGTELRFNGNILQYASKAAGTIQVIANTVATNGRIQLANANRNAAGAASLLLNGTSVATGTISQQPANTALNIGARRNAATPDQFFNGQVAEVAIYNSQLSAADREKVASYLAIKYGITLPHNYIYPNNTVVWDQAANTGYANNITGIGRDDCNGLHQKQSKSINTAAMVTMALGTEITTSNATNLNTFDNNTALLFGDNNAAIGSWTSTESPAGRNRIAREWKVQVSGTVDGVTIQVPANTSAATTKLPAEVNKIYLLIDADGDFSSGATEVPMVLNGDNYEANYDFTGAAYFTFATGTDFLVLTSKVILHGAWDGTAMRTDLKAAGVLPATDPYGLNTTPVVSPNTTPAAVVDWIRVELRDATDPATVVASRAAFVLANGNIVDTNYAQPLAFYGVDAGNYFVAIRHRNHLGILSLNTVDLSAGTASIDFTLSTTETYGSHARKDLGSGVMGLWAGNVDGDQSVRHSAKPSDASAVASAVLTHPGNTTADPAYTGFINAYSPFDVNLDGRVYYTAAPSDRAIIVSNVTTHPANVFGLASFVILQQLP